MIGEDVLFLPVRELGERIRARQLSPVDLTQAYLDRDRKYGRKLKAFAMILPDLALEQARQAETEINQGHYRGPLHGIPYAAKDLLAVKGYPTTWGAMPYRQQVFDYDATVIRKLNDAGAILLGKAAMIELAGGLGYRFASASWTGAAKNPWDTNCWTCGSSSGSGAIMAAGMAAFAIGTETWGSIVCPSAFCGVSGLRPTFGRVGRGGAMALSYSMDKIGPMCRTADDCSIVLMAISGHDPSDAGSLPETEARFAYTPPVKSLRIARVEKAWEKPHPEIAAAFEQAIAVLQRAGATVSSAQLPEGPFETAGGVVINVEASASFSQLIESGDVSRLNDPLSQIGGYVAQTVSGQDFLRAQRIRRVLQQKMDTVFQQCDVLVAPSQPIAAPTLDTNLETGLTFADPLGGIGNLCGLPAQSVPCGFTKAGLPIGIQFLGQVLNDSAVIAAATMFQGRTDWHLRHPQLHDLEGVDK
jgi:aspartyl-tRNA(Asn)/glutamyl-tRNA(Gln) amidotransferase subunit A